jgi:hypothetical protein
MANSDEPSFNLQWNCHPEGQLSIAAVERRVDVLKAVVQCDLRRSFDRLTSAVVALRSGGSNRLRRP